MTTVKQTHFPELELVRRGKVRDVYAKDDKLVIIATDRISAFDHVFDEQVPMKGQLLTEMTDFWFSQVQQIGPNHLLTRPDDNVHVVRKCNPFEIEVVVRGYVAGSLWRSIERGETHKCGVELPQGLEHYARLPTPIITLTTKADEGHDEDITVEEALGKFINLDRWETVEKTSLALFKQGSQIAMENGLILVDTKYEFGLDPKTGETVLIDEIHTPDSSRFWFKKDYDNGEIRPLDKEYVREWLMEQGYSGDGPAPTLTDEVLETASQRYITAFETVTGQTFRGDEFNPIVRIRHNLREAGIIYGGFVPIVAGSRSDADFVARISGDLDSLGIPHAEHYVSAHRDPEEDVRNIVSPYSSSSEPVVFITTAGLSNGLSPAVTKNTHWPVIACPSFATTADYMADIHSTLRVPDGVPQLTTIRAKNAALAAQRIIEGAYK